MEQFIELFGKVADENLRTELAGLLYRAAADGFKPSIYTHGNYSGLSFAKAGIARVYEVTTTADRVNFYRRKPSIDEGLGSDWDKVADLDDTSNSSREAGERKYVATSAADLRRITLSGF